MEVLYCETLGGCFGLVSASGLEQTPVLEISTGSSPAAVPETTAPTRITSHIAVLGAGDTVDNVYQKSCPITSEYMLALKVLQDKLIVYIHCV